MEIGLLQNFFDPLEFRAPAEIIAGRVPFPLSVYQIFRLAARLETGRLYDGFDAGKNSMGTQNALESGRAFPYFNRFSISGK